MADGELSQLDERLREVAESLAAIGTSVKTLEGQVTTMNKALFQSNSHPSLMTRAEVLDSVSGYGRFARLYFAAKYASPSLAEDVQMVVSLLQLPVTAIIVAISAEDSAAMKAGTFLQDEK